MAKLFLFLLVLAAVFPPVEVLMYRSWDPQWIPLMTIRKMHTLSEGHIAPPVRFHWEPLEEMPEYLVRCVVVAEDARFLAHRGIDWIEMRHAIKHSGRGGSTITMQCARTLFLWQGRSYVRKGIEAYYTFWMEMLLTKRRILELYLNVVETGKGIYGFPAAANFYYERPLDELSRQELALLAVILPAPTQWDPREPSPKMRWRQALIVRREKGLRFPASDLLSGRRVD